MKRVGSRQLKNRLGTYLKRVKAGDTILVTHRGQPVARLMPTKVEEEIEDPLTKWLKELQAAGHLRRGTKPFRKFTPVPSGGKPASRWIMEGRR